MAKVSNQPRCSPADEWIKKRSIYGGGVFFIRKEEGNHVVCVRMPRGHGAKRKKPESETSMAYFLSLVEFGR